MRTESEIQDSINSLRAQLGMEVQSEPIAPTVESNQDVQARIDALNEKLATTPMSRREFMKKRAEDDAKSLKQSSFEFIEGMGEGFSLLAKQGKDAVIEAYQELADGDVSFGNVAKGIGDTVSIGTDDFIMFAKTLGGAAMDKIGGYTEEEEIEREYQRYLRNHDYHTVTREQRLENVENRAMVDFGSNFIDPFMLFPVAKLGSLAVRAPLKAGQKAATAAAFAARSKGAVNLARFAKNVDKGIGKVDKVVDIAGRVGAYPTEMAARIGTQVTRKALKGGAYTLGLGLKGVGKVGSVVEKTASLPRRGIAKLASKVPGAKTAALTGQVVGAASGVPFLLEMGIAEGLGAIAKKVGMGAGELATIFGQRGANKRFLYRLATSDKVSESTRRSAMWAYNHFGTSVGDAAFNMMANGLSLGAINAGLSGLAGEDARTSGSAFGTGALAGGLIPAGQRGMKGGKRDSSREQLGIDQYMKDKLSIDQRNQFRKLPKPAQVLLATLQESGVGAPSLRLLDKKTYLDMLNKEREKAGLPLLDRAPGGHFSQQEGSIYLNSDALKEAGDVGVEIAAHEVGHDFMHKALGNDPAMLELILERYKTTKEKGTAFYFHSDKDGKPMGDPIYLNEEATQFAKDYSRKQKGISIGRDAKKLAQEIGADQFAMNFAQDPNIFNHIHPRLRRHLLDGARRMLSSIGVVEPKTGNPLKSPISKQMNRNPSIRRLYQNYAKMRATELNEKADLAKEGILIQPKAGQNGDARYVELFGGVGLNLKDAKNLVVSNKSLLRELIRMRDQWKEEPSDGWSVRRGQLEGKTLTDDLRTIFTRNDQWGNVANIIDALQQAINQRIGIQFGYRSGTKGKYQNPFRLRDVAIYGWQVGSMGGEGRATLKVLGYDQAVVRANVQTLVEKGYITDPDAFMQQLAEQGQAALQDPEGRINPEGRKENELMTVAFGLKESSGQVASPGLRELLESKAVNKSFRSYDVEALAGLTKSESKAFAFDYPNIRDNYNPFRQSESNLYVPDMQTGEIKSLVKVIKDNPDGFTINLQSAWAKRGYVVAPEKRTEEFIDTNNFNLKSLEDYIYKHGDLFDLDGSHLGGWYDTKQDRYTLDVVFPIDNKQEAVEVALWGDQDAIFDLYNFTEIYTKKDGKPIIPEGIEGSLESILQRKPNSNSTFAAEAWRRSQSIREEGSSGVLPRTERAGEEAGGSQAAPPEGQVGDEQFLPIGFHGSPHNFEPEPGAPLGRFRSDKIGTGTGNQVFGYGHYLSSRQEVADRYRDSLTKNIDHTKATYDGKQYDSADIRHQAAWRLKKFPSREMAILSYGEKLNRPGAYISPAERQFYKDLIKVLENKEEAKLDGGSLYKVEITPKDSEFLLWDEYLKNQPKEVKSGLEKVIDKYDMKGLDDRTFGEFYELLALRLEDRNLLGIGDGQAAASAALKDAGIPGIRYKDRRSFLNDTESFNYVVFDDANLIITEKLPMPDEEMFMPLNKDELPQPFTREDGPFGLDILYNDGVILVGPQYQGEAPPRDGFDGRVGRGRFVIYDRKEYDLSVTEDRNPNPAGYVVATTTQDGKFDALIDIKLDKNVRSKGLGTKVVHSMLHDGLNGEIHVKDIMSSAKKFWKKIGVEDFKPFKDSGYKTRTEGVIRLKRDPIKLRGFRDENSYMPTTERQDYKFKISTRNPTAKSRTEDPVTSDLIVSSNDVLSDPEITEGYANAIRQYVGITDKGSNATNVIKNFMGFVVDNLLYLYDSVDPEIRKRSKLWYVGARRIAQDYAQQYNTSPQAVAAVIAATSPQTDWYVNVDKARRILETVRDQQETVFDKKMARKHVALAQQKDKAKARKERKSYEGKKFKDLNIYGQTAFIRAFDEVYRDRSYQIISPEGKFIGKAMTDKGEVATSSWGSGVEIHKGLRALADDSKANISSTMGEAHKIRNFFNNILLPMSDNESVTIDTHAVAAALLKPLAAKDLEVLNMLGSKPKGEGFASIKNSSIKGIKGLYGIYADAYRQAAKMRGVLPREMQSITWEAVRGLYPKEIKKPKFKEEINSLFQLYESGKISIDELRQKITKKADGIDPPSWFGVEDSPGGNRPRSSKPAKGTKPTADEGELFLPAFRGLGTRDTPRGVRAPSSGVTASGLNRFMLPATARATAVSDTLEAFRN